MIYAYGLMITVMIASIICSIYTIIVFNRTITDVFKKWGETIRLNRELIDINKRILKHDRNILNKYVEGEETNNA